MVWRHSTWARWLGWTLGFAILFGGVMLPFAWRVPDNWTFPVLAILAVCFVLCPVAAFWIGRRLQTEAWVAGPPVAVIVTVAAMLLLPSPSSPRQTAIGMTTPKLEFLFVLLMGGGLILMVFAGAYALAAGLGVRSRVHHEATAKGPDATPS